MKLCEILNKTPTKTAIFTFGRFNPPTKGHEKLIDIIKILKNSIPNSDAFIFPSKTHDNKKNPLDFQTKVKFLRIFFPQVKINDNPVLTTFFNILFWLVKNNYKKIILVVGEDRIDIFKNLIYNNIDLIKETTGITDITKNNFSFINSGLRDENQKNISGISASKARQFVINNQLSDFINITAPSTGTEEQKIALFNAVKKGLGK